jgi:hypothetical protein
MTVAVYPRLGPLLAERRLTVAELARQLRERFGLEVNLKTLYRLAQDAPVQRADLEIAGATAALLGVGLDDLFAIEAVPVANGQSQDAMLLPEQSRRLAALFAQQADRLLAADERRELEQLVAEYGRHEHERRLREYAARRHLSLDEARAMVAADYDRALAWWHDFQSDPQQQQALVARGKARRIAEDG